MRRTPKRPAPYFKLPTPHDPLSGARAPLRGFGEFPYCALMQIAEEDTKKDYVICRGYDTRDRRYYDYESGSTEKRGIRVAKPYGFRLEGVYRVGQIYVAFLPLWQISERSDKAHDQNPGVVKSSSDESLGQPLDLGDAIEHLKDDDGVYINWMLVNNPGFMLVELCLAEDHPGQGSPFDAYYGIWSPAVNDWDYDNCSTIVKAIDHRFDVPQPDAGATGLFTPRPSDQYGTIFECVSLDCSSQAACCS